MATCNDTPANASYLAQKTGLDYRVALAWLKNECQSTPNPSNPLNILSGGAPGQTGSTGRFASYGSPQAGLDAAAWLVNNSKHYTGIRAAIATGDPIAQAHAIELSPWAGGHYGGILHPGGVSRTLAKLMNISLPSNPGTSGTGTNTVSGQNTALATWLGKSPTDTFTQADIDKIVAYAHSIGFGTIVETTIVPRLKTYIGKPVSIVPTSVTIDSQHPAFTFPPSSAQGAVQNIVPDIPGAIGAFGSTVAKIATYLVAVGLIAIGIWLYAKNSSGSQPVVAGVPGA